MQDTVGTPVAGSEEIEMNGHGRLGFSLDEYRRRYEVVLGGDGPSETSLWEG